MKLGQCLGPFKSRQLLELEKGEYQTLCKLQCQNAPLFDIKIQIKYTLQSGTYTLHLDMAKLPFVNHIHTAILLTIVM